MKNPTLPDATLLIKLGSLIVHADEYLSPGGHDFDKIAFETGLQDPDVQEWLKEMDAMALLPKKRSEAERKR